MELNKNFIKRTAEESPRNSAEIYDEFGGVYKWHFEEISKIIVVWNSLSLLPPTSLYEDLNGEFAEGFLDKFLDENWRINSISIKSETKSSF